MLARRTLLATAAAAALPLPAHADWQAWFKIQAPLTRLRVIQAPAKGVQVLDGAGDEDALIVMPNQAMTGRIKVTGFRGIYCIGGLVDPSGDGWMYAPSGALVWGVGDTFWLQTAADPVTRPFIYVARLRCRSSHIIYGDLLRPGGAAAAGDWGAWPDLFVHKMLVDARYGWDPSETAQFGEPPAPAHHGDVSHTDFIKQDPGGTRHWYLASIQAEWGFQQVFARPSWATGWQEYRGSDGRAVRQLWDHVAIPRRRIDLGTPTPLAYWAVDDDDMVAAGNYDQLKFRPEGSGVWLVPEPGHTGSSYIMPPQGQHFAPVDHGSWLYWPQVDWPESFAAYLGTISVSAAPPTVVAEQDVGLAWRVTSADELQAYRTQNRHLD